MKLLTRLGLIVLLCFSACKNDKKADETLTALVDWQPTQNYYKMHLTEAMQYLDSLAVTPAESAKAKIYFSKARVAFKKAEPYASYINPVVGHRANGPALPFLTDDSQKVLEPVGLQKIEESIY